MGSQFECSLTPVPLDSEQGEATPDTANVSSLDALLPELAQLAQLRELHWDCAVLGLGSGIPAAWGQPGAFPRLRE